MRRHTGEKGNAALSNALRKKDTPVAPAPEERVIALLDQLGEKLVRSEKERLVLKTVLRRYDSLLADLESRSARSEKAFLSLQGAVSRQEETERGLRERQERIEKEQKTHAEKLQKTDSLMERVEEALADQGRMNRKLEKMTQDKVRLLRKLERIEETVIATKESLNSKALVLLTDQKLAAGSTSGQLPADPLKDAPKRKKLAGDWWSKSLYIQAAGVGALVLVAIFSGWAVSQMPMQSASHVAAETAENTDENTAEQSVAENAAAEDVTKTAGDKTEMTAATPPDQPLEPSLAESTEPAPENTVVADAGTSEDPEMDAIAAQMNEIEPSGNPVPEDLENAAGAAAPDTEQASLPAADAAAPSPDITQDLPADKAAKDESPANKVLVSDADTEAFLRSQQDKGSLTDRITPDPRLSPVAQEIEKKAFEGIPEAQHDLAAIYTAGHGSVQIDYVRAAMWFKEAALQGVANARYNLGVLYHQGMGVEKNIDTAISWYRSAAALGHPEAQYNLAIAYIEGVGTNYNPRLAAAFFEKAANSGITEAAYNLGLIHENGLLGTTSPRAAIYWYKRAADKGSPEAQTALRQLAKSMNIDESDINKIVQEQGGGAPQAITPATPASTPEKQPVKKKTSDASDSTAPANAAAAPVKSASVVQTPSAPVSKAPRGSATRSQELTAQIQEQLIRLNLFPGPANGVDTPQTQDAIRSYQTSRKLESDGRASEALLVHMLTDETSPASPESRQNASRAATETAQILNP